MATVVSQPVKAYVATLNAGGFISHGIGAGRGLTVTVNITGQWEIEVPVGTTYGSNVSLGTLVNVITTDDGGATFNSVPLTSFVIPTAASTKQILPIRLSTGMYLLQMIASSPSTTFYVFTQEAITAINNV